MKMRRRSRALYAFVCAPLLAACQSPIETSLARADSLFMAEDARGAERAYRTTLGQIEAERVRSPMREATERRVLVRLGEIEAYYLHDVAAAVLDWEILVRRYPKSQEARFALEGIADLNHYRLGKLTDAQAAYRRLVRDFPTTQAAPSAQLALVGVAFKQLDYRLARQEAEIVMRRWPDRPEALQARFEVGDALARERRFGEAIAAYEALLADKPDRRLAAMTHFEVGNAHQEMGDMARALPYYYAALAEHPHPALVQHKIGRVRARIHNTLPKNAIYNARIQASRRVTSPKGL